MPYRSGRPDRAPKSSLREIVIGAHAFAFPLALTSHDSLPTLVLWLAAVLAVAACWAAAGWYLWSAARGGKPRTQTLWKLLTTAFALAIGAATRTIYHELRADPVRVWVSEGMLHFAWLLIVLLVPFAIAVISLRESD